MLLLIIQCLLPLCVAIDVCCRQKEPGRPRGLTSKYQSAFIPSGMRINGDGGYILIDREVSVLRSYAAFRVFPDRTCSCSPSALTTFNTVESSGLPWADKAL
jgi:hypothetical protein